MCDPLTPARRVRALFVPALAALVVLASSSLLVFAQQSGQPVPFWKKPAGPSGQPPAETPTPTPTPAPARPQQRPQQQAPAPPAAQVIARVEGRPITQAEFDNIANPYFARIRADVGDGFEGDLKKIAVHNVFDELVRLQLLAVEAQRQKIEVSPADIDEILQQDPFFQTNGKFDAGKLAQYKMNPGSNYAQVLPRIRELAAMNKLDGSLRARFTPSPAAVRAEWAKRNDQVRVKLLPLMLRDMSLEPEATETEWADYYKAHPDQFMKKTRLRLRFARVLLPAEGDSTRPAEEPKALARAKAIADSLRAGTLPDTSSELTDTGFFDLPAPAIPGIGRQTAMSDTLARAETDTMIRVIGPYYLRDGVVVARIVGREPRHLPPMSEVLGDVKRRADAEKRQAAAEADRRAYYQDHLDRWRGPRVQVSRVVMGPESVKPRDPAAGEVDRWYAQHGHRLFGQPDSSRAWLPPITDSLRFVARLHLAEELREQKAGETLDKIAAALRTTRDVRQVGKTFTAVAETLTFFGGSPPDTLFMGPMLDSILTTAVERKGQVQGPRLLGRWVLWRVDAVDTTFVPPYDAVRAKSDQAFNDEKRRKDEADGQAYYEKHRTDYKTPVRYVVDYVSVRVAPPDSVRIPEAELKRSYESNLKAYKQEEQVKARHILFMTRDAGPEVEAKAKVRADSLLKALKAGADFVDLARRFSQEPGASESGGDLGWFGKGRMVKEFEDAAFKLKPGEMSPVVKTMLGYHIIKVEDRTAAGQRPFAEVREELRAQMAQARGDSLARLSAAALRRRLALAADPKPVAAAHGGIQTSQAFAATEPIPGVGYVQGLQQDLPTLATGKWAAKPYRTGGTYVILRVRERVPQKPATFDEVRTAATEDAKNAKRKELLDHRVTAVRSALAGGAALDSVAAPYGGLKDSGLLSLSGAFMPGVGNDPRLVERAFALKRGEQTDTLHVQSGVVWMRLEEKKPGDPAEFKKAELALSQELTKKKYDEWVEQKKKTVKIEIFRPDLREPRPSPFKTVVMNTGG